MLEACATPPGQSPVWPPENCAFTGDPAASSATVVPWPTLSSTLRSKPVQLLGGMMLRVTRGDSPGWLRSTPESSTPMVTPWPVRPAPSAPAALVSCRCADSCWLPRSRGAARAGTAGGFTTRLASLATVGVKPIPVGGGGVAGGGVGRTELPPPPQAVSANATAAGRMATPRARWKRAVVVRVIWNSPVFKHTRNPRATSSCCKPEHARMQPRQSEHCPRVHPLRFRAIIGRSGHAPAPTPVLESP